LIDGTDLEKDRPMSTVELLQANGRPAVARSAGVAVAGYVAAIALCEVVFAFVDTTAGVICHAALLLGLLTHYIAAEHASATSLGRDRADDALAALALVPLLRILSVTVPFEELPRIWWFAFTGIPLLVAAALTARLLGLNAAAMGIQVRTWASQLPIALSGIPLSLSAYVLLRPDPIVGSLDAQDLILGSIILMAFTGLAEELVFRGIIQTAFVRLYGAVGLVWSSVVFAALYAGSGSAGYVLFIGLVGLAFGWCLERTGSIAGISLAHGLLNIGLILVWPAVLG
jgi:uncharacterized protein